MPLDLAQLRARMPGRNLVWLDTTPTTMLEAARLAADGAASGTLVVAEEQTAGQGRQGKTWRSERELGLYVSLLLRPALGGVSLQLVTLAAGLAAQEAVYRVAGITCQIKWPNDLLYTGRKCGGILCRTADAAVIAGVGINVNHEFFPSELEETAISLRMATGRPHSREDLLAALAESVDNYCGLLERQGAGAILRLYAGRARPR